MSTPAESPLVAKFRAVLAAQSNTPEAKREAALMKREALLARLAAATENNERFRLAQEIWDLPV